MKPQEDIGSLIKAKLQSSEKASNEATWDRIQHSLEERKRKRRFAFYIKLGSAGMLILVGMLLVPNYINLKNEDSVISQEEINVLSNDQRTILTEQTPTNQKATIPIAHSVTTPDTSTTKTLDIKSTQTQATIKKVTTEKNINYTLGKTEATPVADKYKENSPKTNAPITQEINHKKTQDTLTNRNDTPVTHTTKKVYYYYNSKNGQEVSTTNKKVIDSIVKINETKQDSIKTNL